MLYEVITGGYYPGWSNMDRDNVRYGRRTATGSSEGRNGGTRDASAIAGSRRATASANTKSGTTETRRTTGTNVRNTTGTRDVKSANSSAVLTEGRRSGTVITSYSIHYTKLYDKEFCYFLFKDKLFFSDILSFIHFFMKFTSLCLLIFYKRSQY